MPKVRPKVKVGGFDLYAEKQKAINSINPACKCCGDPISTRKLIEHRMIEALRLAKKPKLP